jgi:hypothetical protein
MVCNLNPAAGLVPFAVALVRDLFAVCLRVGIQSRTKMLQIHMLRLDAVQRSLPLLHSDKH